MTNHTQERLLFVVAVDQSELETQPTLQALKIQIIEESNNKQDNRPLIKQIQAAIQSEKVLANKVNLLRLDVYLTIFAGVIEVDSDAIQPIPGKPAGWQLDASFVQPLLRAIFSGDKAALTWTLLRVSELTAEPMGDFSLLGMQGISGRK